MKKIQKQLVIGIMSLSFLFTAVPAFAQSTQIQTRAQLESKLRMLLIQLVQELQAELDAQEKKQKSTQETHASEAEKESKETTTKIALANTSKNTQKTKSTSQNNNISEKTLSSSKANKNDTASFTFKIPVSTFGNPLYVPVIGTEAIDLDLIDASLNRDVAGISSISVSSSAKKVDGNDGNVYFKISGQEHLNITITAKPGAGDYYAELDALRFTSQDVSDSAFTSFSPINLNLGDKWRSKTLTLLN